VPAATGQNRCAARTASDDTGLTGEIGSSGEADPGDGGAADDGAGDGGDVNADVGAEHL